MRASRLTGGDTVVLTDFSNNTGDAIFDDTLKQALKVSLSQSPFLKILPERTVRATLKLMTQPANSPISPSIAREVGQRSGSKAFISGAIASLDTDYVIGLKAENCINGRVLAQVQVTARSKDEVIAQLGNAATDLRSAGESISTVKKFDVPLRRATTGSLEALKEYTWVDRPRTRRDHPRPSPIYKKAIALDPLFARAYSALSAEYFDSGESTLAAFTAPKPTNCAAGLPTWRRLRSTPRITASLLATLKKPRTHMIGIFVLVQVTILQATPDQNPKVVRFPDNNSAEISDNGKTSVLHTGDHWQLVADGHHRQRSR